MNTLPDLDENITDLDITRITLGKNGIKYHELQEGDYTYIQVFGQHDSEGYIYVHAYGRVRLTKSEQLDNFMEFENGKLVSY